MEPTKTTFLDSAKNILLTGLDNILFIVVVFACATFILKVISGFTGKKIHDSGSQDISTRLTLFRSLARYLIYAFAFIICLSHIGVQDKLSSAFVTAGISGLVLSLGAQSLVKDIISGIIIAFEKPYLVGDWVRIGDYDGEVTAVSLRATYLDQLGSRAIIPNGQVSNVVNYSKANGYLDIKFPVVQSVAYSDASSIASKALKDYYKKHQDVFIKEPVVKGIGDADRFGYYLSVTGHVKPLKQWTTEKEIKAEIKKAFDKNNIQY